MSDVAQFDDLSDYDFELLVADLLGREHGCRFEIFSRGPDGGIDLRTRLGDGFHYVQCKHYALSGFSRLKKAAERERQAFQRDRPKPRRYTFVTSRRLTAENKQTLIEVLRPLVRDESDILGSQDLATLLRTHPEVERAHVKLWLRAVSPLERIVNADIHARTEALVGDILGDLPRYVQTRSFSQAQKALA
jgi:hypothetical protein